MKRSLSEMYDDAEAKAEKKRQEHMTRILKRSETVQEKNHYFSDELWLSLENKTLSEKFLRRFSKQFRQRLNYQLKKYIHDCDSMYDGDEITQFLLCDFKSFCENYLQKCAKLRALCELHAESFARLGITLSDKPCIGFIKPITFAKSREQLTSLCHHSNIQPMYNVLNQKKAFHWCQEDNEDWKRTIFMKEKNEEIFLTRHMLKLLKM